MELTAPVDVPVVAAPNSAEAAVAEADLLALHGAAGQLGRGAGPGHLGPGQQRDRDRRAAAPSRARMATPWRRSLTIRPKAQAIANGMTRSRKISKHVGERRRVLERVRGVDVVEAAAVGAELLDRLLAGDRAAGQLLAAAGRACASSWSPAKFWTAPKQDEDAAPRPARSAAAPGPRRAPGRPRSCRPGRRSRCARGRGRTRRRRPCRRAADDEVLDGQAGHLHQVAERGLAGVPLPVGVGHEADGGVPGAVGRAAPGSRATAAGAAGAGRSRRAPGCRPGEKPSTDMA